MKIKIFYDLNFKVYKEFVENFITYYKFMKTNNLNDSDIIFFNNFTLENRKFLIKNKNLKQKIFCYFHEPITFKNSENMKMLRRLKELPKIRVLTYSKYNQIILEKFLSRKVSYLPITYYHLRNISLEEKKIDIVINHRKNIDCFKKNNYNSKIINLLNDNYIILNHWDEERDNLFKNCKIFINLHKNEQSQMLETLRIHNLIYNRIIVISQKCIDYSDPLSKYIIYVDDNKLLETAEEVLKNYSIYYDKIYYNKTNKEIFEDIEKYYQEILK